MQFLPRWDVNFRMLSQEFIHCSGPALGRPHNEEVGRFHAVSSFRPAKERPAFPIKDHAFLRRKKVASKYAANPQAAQSMNLTMLSLPTRDSQNFQPIPSERKHTRPRPSNDNKEEPGKS